MIQVIERFHKIIERVAAEPERACSLSELAKTIGVSLPACSNIVRTMVHLGYLQSLGERKGYILGSMPYFLTRKGPFMKHVSIVARPAMEELSRKLNEMLVLVADCNGRRAELLRFEGASMIQVKELPSERAPSLFSCATGMLILAYMDEARVKTLWDWDSSHDFVSIVKAKSLDDIYKASAKIRKDGAFISEHDPAKDIMDEYITLAFPVFEDGKLRAALGSKIPAYRFVGERRELAVSSCRSAANQISEALGKANA